MPKTAPLVLIALLIPAFPAAAADSDGGMRERAVANCKANRGTDCESAEGLKEWIDAERPRPPGQRSAIQLQKLEAERRAQQRLEEARKREKDAQKPK